MDFKRPALLSTVAVLALALWLMWLWQPERQVRRHTQSLLKAIERRHWSKVETLLADTYADRWGHDKAFVLEGLRRTFGSFLFLTIEHRETGGNLAAGEHSAQVKISGQGGPIGDLVITKVNSLAEPFTFTWCKREGGPWAWELIRVDHPTLEPTGFE